MDFLRCVAKKGTSSKTPVIGRLVLSTPQVGRENIIAVRSASVLVDSRQKSCRCCCSEGFYSLYYNNAQSVSNHPLTNNTTSYLNITNVPFFCILVLDIFLLHGRYVNLIAPCWTLDNNGAELGSPISEILVGLLDDSLAG